MKIRYQFAIAGFLGCAILFYLSGSPLQRGWPLWGAGLMTIIVCIAGLAIGYGCEQSIDGGDDDL